MTVGHQFIERWMQGKEKKTKTIVQGLEENSSVVMTSQDNKIKIDKLSDVLKAVWFQK